MMRKTVPDSLTILRAMVSVLFLCAMTGLALTGLFGFEEPNTALLVLSSTLLLTAILAVFVHLAVNRVLNREQKRIWLHRLTGRRALSAWAEYLSCDDLPAAATRFTGDASARR